MNKWRKKKEIENREERKSKLRRRLVVKAKMREKAYD
jgi:hypothetical protein